MAIVSQSSQSRHHWPKFPQNNRTTIVLCPKICYNSRLN
ncbi:hypothetical protein AO369_1932 [Moraxella catarrhalis]|nr:hypothetical protein AO369_1932 [Moraxella catarrhalis]